MEDIYLSPHPPLYETLLYVIIYIAIGWRKGVPVNGSFHISMATLLKVSGFACGQCIKCKVKHVCDHRSFYE